MAKKKRKPRTCKCIDRLNADLAEFNTELDLVHSINFTNGSSRDWIQLATRKIDSKKRGKPKAVVASYCPSCGRKL